MLTTRYCSRAAKILVVSSEDHTPKPAQAPQVPGRGTHAVLFWYAPLLWATSISFIACLPELLYASVASPSASGPGLEWRPAPLIDLPETVVRWHRVKFKVDWNWSSGAGGPSRLRSRTTNCAN